MYCHIGAEPLMSACWGNIDDKLSCEAVERQPRRRDTADLRPTE